MSRFESAFNLAEAGLWFAVASVLLLKAAFATARMRSTLLLLAFAFFIFGISDLVEARTGAWWDPLWLLAMKGACIVAFFVGFRRYYRLLPPKTGPKEPPKSSEPTG